MTNRPKRVIHNPKSAVNPGIHGACLLVVRVQESVLESLAPCDAHPFILNFEIVKATLKMVFANILL
jgi:hypothetical protein